MICASHAKMPPPTGGLKPLLIVNKNLRKPFFSNMFTIDIFEGIFHAMKLSKSEKQCCIISYRAYGHTFQILGRGREIQRPAVVS